MNKPKRTIEKLDKQEIKGLLAIGRVDLAFIDKINELIDAHNTSIQDTDEDETNLDLFLSRLGIDGDTMDDIRWFIKDNFIPTKK